MNETKRGLFTVDRGVFNHPAFANEPFTEREAWLWIVSEAGWADRSVRVGKGYDFVELARGQLTHSLRFMGEKWQWKKDRVARFLKMLEKHDMIATHSATGQNVLTVCNYEKFQDFDEYRATAARQEPRRNADSDATATRQQRDKEEHLPTPSNKTTTTRRREDLDQMEDKLRAAAGDSLNPTQAGLSDLTRPILWIEKGCDLDTVILPAIREAASRKQRMSVGSWRYFDGAVMDAKARSEKPLPAGSAGGGTTNTGVIRLFGDDQKTANGAD